jgi:hypothetical protein
VTRSKWDNEEFLEAGRSGSRVAVEHGNFLGSKDIARRIWRFLAANLAADEGNAYARIRPAHAVTGVGNRNGCMRPAEKADDNVIARALWLLGHKTLQN